MATRSSCVSFHFQKDLGPAQKSLIDKITNVDELNAFVSGIDSEMSNAAWMTLYDALEELKVTLYSLCPNETVSQNQELAATDTKYKKVASFSRKSV